MKIKKALTAITVMMAVLAMCGLFALIKSIYATADTNCEFYNEYVQYSKSVNPYLDILTYEEFYEEYSDKEIDIRQFTDDIKLLIDTSVECGISTTSSIGNEWYKNTGLTLPQIPDYSKYNLLDKVKLGDILYENKGFGGITGHIAIVEGIFYDTTFKTYYIRVLETFAGGGVCRGVLDDTRFLERQGIMLNIPSANASQRLEAVNFVETQLGKPWVVQINKPTSANTSSWQCSTLVWAGYKRQGIDIEKKGIATDIGVTPHDILMASTVSKFAHFKY